MIETQNPNFISQAMCRRWQRFAVGILMLFVASLTSAPTLANTKVALVIGNSAYDWSPLSNPVNDAKDMAATLEELGFQVLTYTDVSRVGMHRAIREFGNQLERADVGLFYYAGHGLQVNGKNYLVPLGADIRSEDEISFETIDASRVLAKMESAKNPVNIVILDACRNNPFESSSRSGSRGLARMDSPTGSLLLYATAPNQTASDGAGRNGVLTGNLIENLKEPGLTLDQVVLKTRIGVMSDTDNGQVPWSASSLTRNVVLNPQAAGQTQQLAALDPSPQPSAPNNGQKPAINASALLRICKKHFRANRLTTGKGGSALGCYQKVLDSDPYNIEAIDGIDNIANKYISWIQRTIESQRFAKAEQHLTSLRTINEEHPVLEELQYSLMKARDNGDASAGVFASIAEENNSTSANTESALLQTTPAASNNSVASSQTSETQISQIQDNADSESVGTLSTSDAITVAANDPDNSPSQTATLTRGSTEIEPVAETIEQNNNQPEQQPEQQEEPLEIAAIAEPEPEQQEVITEAVEELVPAPAAIEDTGPKPEVVIALAGNTMEANRPLCPDCLQPAAESGEPCIGLEVLQADFKPSTFNTCYTHVKGTCMDVEYKFKVSNICPDPVRVEWIFETNSNNILTGEGVLENNQAAILSCLHNEQDCAGRIRYGWDSTVQQF